MKKAKKLFMKKYDNIFVLAFVSLISVALPSSIYAACLPGVSCKTTNINANSSATVKTADGGGSCGGYNIVFQIQMKI